MKDFEKNELLVISETIILRCQYFYMGFSIFPCYLCIDSYLQIEKKLVKVWLRLKIQSEIAIFTTTTKIEISFWHEANTLTHMYIDLFKIEKPV